MPDAVAIIANNATSRLRYVCHTLFTEWWQIPYSIYDATQPPEGENIVLCYGVKRANALHIPACGLLDEMGIHEKWRYPKSDNWQGMPAIFANDDKGVGAISFDIFSALFWVITRYEEYLSYPPDKHDRYPHIESYLYQKGWLKKPVADIWAEVLRKRVESFFQVSIPPYSFSLQPSYDIDIAWSFLYKGWKRTTGALMKNIAQGKWNTLSRRLKALSGKALDDYDSFSFLHQLHKELSIIPLYFLLCAAKTTAYDKNNDRTLQEVQELYQQLSIEGKVGIHPSYYTKDNRALLQDERSYLSKLMAQKIHRSRQHYFRMRIPQTYRQLIAEGISEDYSMGYGSISGFRAGTARPFSFYDIESEEHTTLKVFPFFFMDTAAHFAEKKTWQSAYEELHLLTETIKAQGGVAIPVYHNFSLGTEPQWSGWREAYEKYLRSYF